MTKEEMIEYLKDSLRVRTTCSFYGTPYIKLVLTDDAGVEHTLSEEMIDIPRCEHD